MPIVLLLIFSITTLNASADIKVDEHSFKDSVVVDGKTLYLNGAGLRKVKRYGMTFRVYEAGLYLENSLETSEEIQNDNGIKQVRTVYVRSLAPDRQRGAWSKAIKENCYVDCAGSKKMIENWNSKLTETKDGGRFDVTFYPDKVVLEIDGEKKVNETFKGAAFSKDLLNVWLGEKAASQDLKRAFLKGRRSEGSESQ